MAPSERERKVKVRVRPHRSVMIDGALVRDGGEAMVPVADAEALIEQRLVEKPDEPLDADDVRNAEEARAVAESEQQRADVDRRAARGYAVARANAEQQQVDEEARERNAYAFHLAKARLAAGRSPARLRGDDDDPLSGDA